MNTILHYLPYILLFAAATMLIYGWGLWRTMRQKQDLSNLLCSKGISRIRKALKKNGPMTRQELENTVKGLYASQPFQKERIGVTNPKEFLNTVLPYMLKQKMIAEEKENNKVKYRLNK